MRVQNASCCEYHKTYKGMAHTTIVLNTSNTTAQTGRKPLDEIIAKVQLGTKIAQIALACPTCQGPVNKEIQEFKNCHQEGGRPSLPAMNDSQENLSNEINTLEYK
jgi:hypothetical protein